MRLDQARPGIRASLAAPTGVDYASDVVKYLLVGADVVMTELRGKLALPPDAAQAAYRRAGYVRARQAANRARSPR